MGLVLVFLPLVQLCTSFGDFVMLKIQSPKLQGRRAVLQAGVLSIAGLNLATQKRLIAEGTAKKNNKSVILLRAALNMFICECSYSACAHCATSLHHLNPSLFRDGKFQCFEPSIYYRQ